MRVLLTGGTGVVGRATAKALLVQGHAVSAFGQGERRARTLRLLGVTPLDVDLYDAPKLPGVMRDFDAILHLATRIPPAAQMWRKRAWVENDELRTVATGLLVDAALTASPRIFVLHGISLLYGDRGADWIDESSPFDTPRSYRSMLDAEAHVQRFTAQGRTGIVLRNGLFYGAECASVHESLDAARKWKLAAMVGPREAYFSSLHIDDAASATAAALSAPPGAYNVCDDDPVTRSAYIDHFTRAFGVGELWSVPSWLAGLGGANVRMMMRSQRVSNRRFKDLTGWQPRFFSVRDGWPAVAAALSESAAA